MSNAQIDSQTEVQIVARIARNDPYDEILSDLNTKGIQISKSTLTAIKKRNSEALKFMQSEMVKEELGISQRLLKKSRQLLEQKLDNALNVDEELVELKKAWESGELEPKEYFDLVDIAIRRRNLTATEITAITKEMFNQSQVEQGKPTSITDNPIEAKARLNKLLTAINEHDDKSAIEAIFLDA